jgi:hypothetical protein|tara:strand:- start:2318 stop:2605 length:288 start_codon:yes stop_codon:yes gene_type:complete
MVLIYSTDKYGSAHFRSSEVDGQVDNKVKYALKYIQNHMFAYKDIQKFINSEIKFEEPNANLHSFNGIFTHPGSSLENAIERDIVENLDISNTIW